MTANQDGHYGEEDLILYYYGESPCAGEIDAHMGQCDACAASYRLLLDTMRSIAAPDVPHRDERYGLEVWQRIRTRLPERRPLWQRMWQASVGRGLRGGGRLQWAVVAASLVIVGFVAGRWGHVPLSEAEAPTLDVSTPSRPTGASPSRATIPTESFEDQRRRVLLLAVAEHFDESDRALTEFLNAGDARDVQQEQQWAEDLLSANRLYRRDAVDADEASVAATLDDLERALLEIVHTPSLVTREQLDVLERRIDSAALLFKVRVMGDDLRRRELVSPASERQNGPRTAKVS